MRKLIAVSAVLAGFTLGPAGSAIAVTRPSSCMGHEASSLSPPGSSDESPRGMRDFNAFFRTSFPGTPSGSYISQIAGLHEPTHAECDEAIEQLFE